MTRAIEQILDTGIANAYMLAYLAEAVRRAGLSEEQAESVRQGFLAALDLYTAEEILQTNQTLDKKISNAEKSAKQNSFKHQKTQKKKGKKYENRF